MATQRDALEETIDRLYGLPLDEFTAARDAAAKERRAAKDRDGAETLRRLRKPNLVAWSLNQVQRRDPAVIEELIAAGERLGEAQRQLVESGERGSLRGAAADERAQVGHVAELASAELSAAGHGPDAGLQSKLFATLHAAAASSEVRERLARGRLVRDHELSDLGLGDAVSLATPTRPARPPRSAPKRSVDGGPSPKPPRGRRGAAKALRDRLARAGDRHRELAERAQAARRVAQDAERAAQNAARTAQQAERAARDAERAAQQAERAARQAVKELERAEKTAEKAAAAADRAATAADQAEASVRALRDEIAAFD